MPCKFQVAKINMIFFFHLLFICFSLFMPSHLKDFQAISV